MENSPNLTRERKKEWKCFPPSRKFERLYRSKYINKYTHMQNYEAEKTWSTIDKWLSRKCVLSYTPVPLYASYDYEKYLGDDIIVKVDAPNRIARIRSVLDDIVEFHDEDIYEDENN